MKKQRPKSRSDLHWKKQWQIPDQQIVDAANQYQDASELLAKKTPLSGVLLPQMNAAAMSIELYLKSLSAERIYTPDMEMPEVSIVSSSPKMAAHSLPKLFDAIRSNVRNQLIAAYDTKLRIELEDDFKTALKKIDEAFLASRYPFERGANITKYRIGHIMRLAWFLREFVKSLPVREQIEG